MKIEYPAYIFDDLGMGRAPYHDLFTYLRETPPEGYEYVVNPTPLMRFNEPWLLDTIDQPGWDKHLLNHSVYLQQWRYTARQLGIADKEFNEFLLTRPMSRNISQVPPGVPVFFPTFTLFTAPNDWFIEIEDWVTLFYPWISNGNTHMANPHDFPCTKILKALFMQPNFKGVITHVKSTISHLKIIFGEELAHKFHYVPIGFARPDITEKRKPSDQIHLLFHGSFNHSNVHFFLRGGMEVVTAFRLSEMEKNLHLTIIYDEAGMTSVDPGTMRYIKTHPRIRYIGRRVSEPDLRQELLKADALVIPAYRLHSVTSTKALWHGCSVITSNGWGFDEYVKDEYNGFIVPGQVNSWTDNQGIFRESYRTTYGLISQVAEGLSERFRRFAKNPALAHQMSKNALDYAEKHLSVENRNKLLKDLFDKGYQCSEPK